MHQDRPPKEGVMRLRRLRDGTLVLIRPLGPQDERAWRAMLEACSLETIWLRFGCSFKEKIVSEANRFCTAESSSEVILGAELLGEPGRLIGEARLCRAPHGEAAEFAVLVADLWQGQGLGSALTDHCLDLARQWGIRRVLTELVPENARMISLLRSRGFRFVCDPQGRIVLGERWLDEPS